MAAVEESVKSQVLLFDELPGPLLESTDDTNMVAGKEPCLLPCSKKRELHLTKALVNL